MYKPHRLRLLGMPALSALAILLSVSIGQAATNVPVRRLSDGTFWPDNQRACSRTIDAHYAHNPWLGAARGPEIFLPDGGRYRDYSTGSIYLHPASGCAFAVINGFSSHHRAQGRHLGFIGYPVSDEMASAGVSFQFFERGSLWWTQATGVRELRHAIAAKHFDMGGPDAGVPSTDQVTEDGIGEYVHLTNDHSIFWSPVSGAHVVRSGIRAHYGMLGWDGSYLGYPITDEWCSAAPECRNTFQYGTINWTPRRGSWDVRFANANEDVMKAAAADEAIDVDIAISSVESVRSSTWNRFGRQDWIRVYISGHQTDTSVALTPQVASHIVKNVKAGERRDLNRSVFPAGDQRRTVGYGEAVAAHVVLQAGANYEFGQPTWYGDLGSFYKILDYATLRSNEGRTILFREEIAAYGARYRVNGRVVIGRPYHKRQTRLRVPIIVPSQWAGAYVWVADGWRDDAQLQFVAPTPDHPLAQFAGTWTENGHTFAIVTRSLLHNRLDISLVDPADAAAPSETALAQRPVSLYLVRGEGGYGVALAGSYPLDGQTYGIYMRKVTP
jgi:hypothetical protein